MLHRLAIALLLSALLAPAVPAQTNVPSPSNTNTWSESDTMRVVQEVRKRLAGLPRYGVFDDLHFAVKGKAVILEGDASRPILKSDAENAVKGIPGIASVVNQIHVLPLSPNDDRIRAEVYRRIYSQPALRKYTGGSVGFGRTPSVARMAGGITQDPPLGYHAIHILVDGGRVTLKGVVNNEMDANIANMQANTAFGVFSVDNDLLVPGNANQNAK